MAGRLVKGESRTVLILPSLQIVLKFPRVRVRSLILLKRSLVKGVLNNWREWRYFKKHPELCVLLQPTYFSLLGFLNVQKFGKPPSEDDGEAIYYAFYAIAGQDLIYDGHHWVNAENFHLATDGPKLLDYGSTRTQAILDKFGIELYHRFDINFGRAQYAYYRAKRASP